LIPYSFTFIGCKVTKKNEEQSVKRKEFPENRVFFCEASHRFYADGDDEPLQRYELF